VPRPERRLGARPSGRTTHSGGRGPREHPGHGGRARRGAMQAERRRAHTPAPTRAPRAPSTWSRRTVPAPSRRASRSARSRTRLATEMRTRYGWARDSRRARLRVVPRQLGVAAAGVARSCHLRASGMMWKARRRARCRLLQVVAPE
jgi:hypothetical protein